MRAMWLMLQQPEPSDYVIATGETHSVRELVDCAFSYLGLEYQRYVRSDPALVRGRAELHHLVGNAEEGAAGVGWRPSVSFGELVELLVVADANALAAARPVTDEAPTLSVVVPVFNLAESIDTSLGDPRSCRGGIDAALR